MKLTLLQKYLQDSKIDLAYFADPDLTITYFTQITPSHALFTITPKSATLYLSTLDLTPKIQRIKIGTLSKDLDNKLKDENIKKVGINKNSLTLAQRQRAGKIYPNAKFVDISSYLDELRRIKLSIEVAKHKKACQITAQAFNALVKELSKKTLKTEMDVALFLESFMRRKGCELAFPTIAAFGKNAAVPHHVTGTTKLGRGVLLVDFGARYQNYCADMTRCVFLGTPTTQEKEMYELLLKAQELGIKLVKEGMKFTDIDTRVREKLGKYAKYYIHSLGHGIGIEVHEEPFYRKGIKIEKGNLFTIEPGLYFPGKFGLRIEDTLLFDGKTRVLTKSASKSLKIITWR